MKLLPTNVQEARENSYCLGQALHDEDFIPPYQIYPIKVTQSTFRAIAWADRDVAFELYKSNSYILPTHVWAVKNIHTDIMVVGVFWQKSSAKAHRDKKNIAFFTPTD